MISFLIVERSLLVKPQVSFTQGCFVPSLVEIGQVVSEEDFLNFVNRFLLFHNYLCLEKGVALHLNQLESPLSKDALCQVWLKLHGPMILKMKIFKFR